MPLHLNNPDIAETRGGAARLPDAARLTRRSFLALCVAGCSQIVRTPPLPPRRDPARGQTWALVSDTHISAMRDELVRGSCMAENLSRVVAEVVAATPDHVLFNGDVARATGEPGDYAAFLDLISRLSARGTPLHLTLGNHDDRTHFTAALGIGVGSPVAEKAVSRLALGGVEWYFLDSLELVNGVPGRLGDAQRDWLAQQLDSSAAPAIVCVHHNPERLLVGLTDVEEFLAIVLPRRQVKAVLFGHTHEFRTWESEGLHFINLPATAYRFRADASLGWVLAHLRSGGIRLEFRAIDPRQAADGRIQDLCWRSDA
jgi:hypothetical protein